MNSCYLCHFYILIFKSDLSVRLSCIFLYYLIRLIWRVYQMSENRGRVEGRTFVVVNGSFPLFWRFPWKNTARPARTTKRPAEKGRCSRYGSALSLRNICWELTHICFEKLFTFFCSFRSEPSDRQIFIFLSLLVR